MHPFIFLFDKALLMSSKSSFVLPRTRSKDFSGSPMMTFRWVTQLGGGFKGYEYHWNSWEKNSFMITWEVPCCYIVVSFRFMKKQQYECVGLGSSSIAIWFIPRWWLPTLRKPVFAVMVWWNSWSPPMHRRRPKDSVVNAVAEMKNFACFCMYHGYPLFPLFLGWVGILLGISLYVFWHAL